MTENNSPIKIIIVCTFGAGSGVLLKMNVEKAIKEQGCDDIIVEVCDSGSLKSVDCDGIITTVAHEETVKGHPTSKAYAAVKGTFNYSDIKEKVDGLLTELGLLE